MQKDSQILQKQPASDMWTSLVEDFRVKTSALPESVKVLKANALDCGVKCTELYGRLDLNTSSLKIRQLSLFPVLNKSYATFPKSGIMRNGNVYQTTLLDTHTKGKDSLVSGKLLLRIRKYLINNIFRGQTPVHDLKCLHLQSVS